ncbi:hypothetical protein CAC42_178 [Sphaceloma murrayae]|uniref:Uncharacterized protein n=1 Tax=Sphaceloma murrayae TaxID=2082308 RepID=A0A2K1QMS9_9PEZI|nr:hypothetical protein CAC42_178 [Sphaceloma murrayae]
MPAPLPTPEIPTGGVFSASASVTINAPASVIYEAHVDSTSWPKWNTFVPHLEIKSQPPGTDAQSTRLVQGTDMSFTVQMSPRMSTKSTEQITSVSPAPKPEDAPGTKYQIAWASRMAPALVMRSHRVNEITKVDEGKCEYTSWMTFAGPAAYAVKWTQESTLQARFEDWVRDLKAYCEGPEREAGETTEVVEGEGQTGGVGS